MHRAVQFKDLRTCKSPNPLSRARSLAYNTRTMEVYEEVHDGEGEEAVRDDNG